MGHPDCPVRLCRILAIVGFFLCSAPSFAAQGFTGWLNSDGINVRSDSTVSSAVITTLNKAEPVEVVDERYEWYKIRLPSQSPAYIKKNLVLRLDGKSGRVLKEGCNIRLSPDEKAPILGKADKDEIIAVLQESGEWYRIIPTANTFGWVHRRFVNKVKTDSIKYNDLRPAVNKEIAVVPPNADKDVVIEGVIESYGKVIKRRGTHKLVTVDEKTYILKGNPKNLDSVTGYRARISGRVINDKAQKYPVIEITKLEILN